MAVTRSEIATRALKKLGVVRLNQVPDAVRHNAALQIYDEVYAEMEELGIPKWTSTGDVPNEAAFHVISLVSYRLTNDIAVPDSKYQRLALDASFAESEIRRILAKNYVSEETKVTDF